MFIKWNDRALVSVEWQPEVEVPVSKGWYSYQTHASLKGMVYTKKERKQKERKESDKKKKKKEEQIPNFVSGVRALSLEIWTGNCSKLITL